MKTEITQLTSSYFSLIRRIIIIMLQYWMFNGRTESLIEQSYYYENQKVLHELGHYNGNQRVFYRDITIEQLLRWDGCIVPANICMAG